jgi:hypothetical protein
VTAINILKTEEKDMALKAAFMFLGPEVDPQKDRQTAVTPQV